jgi:plastocyanin
MMPEETPTPPTIFGSGLTKKSKPPLPLIIALLVLTVLLVSVAVWYVFKKSTAEPVASERGAVAAISRTVSIVEIRPTGMWPQALQVKAGQQVTFVNKDAIPHRLIADKEYIYEFDSVDFLATNSSYTYVFDTPGTYTYYDSADGIKLKGTVEVQ